MERGRRTKKPPSDVPESPVSLRETTLSLSPDDVPAASTTPRPRRSASQSTSTYAHTHFSTETVPLYLDEMSPSSEVPAVRISGCEPTSGVNLGSVSMGSSSLVTDRDEQEDTAHDHLDAHFARSVSRGRPLSAEGAPLHVRGPRAPSAERLRRVLVSGPSSERASPMTPRRTALGEPFDSELGYAAESGGDVWESVRGLRLAGSAEEEEDLRARLVARSTSTLALAASTDADAGVGSAS